jgi:hypothetical protein
MHCGLTRCCITGQDRFWHCGIFRQSITLGRRLVLNANWVGQPNSVVGISGLPRNLDKAICRE